MNVFLSDADNDGISFFFVIMNILLQHLPLSSLEDIFLLNFADRHVFDQVISSPTECGQMCLIFARK